MPADAKRWPVSRFGSGETPILFIHGFLGCKEDWSEIIDQMSEEHACLAVDLPGHGANSQAEVPDFLPLIGKLDLQRSLWNVNQMHVVGYSMGGRIALQYALQHRSHVASLSLISSSPGIDDPDARAQRVETDHRWARMMQTSEPSVCLKAWYDQAVFDSLREKPEMHARITERRGLVDFRAMAVVLEKWGQGITPSCWRRINELPMPIMMVAGKQDDAYCAYAERLKRLCPRARIAMVQGAGHSVHLEQPDKLAIILEHFISRGTKR